MSLLTVKNLIFIALTMNVVSFLTWTWLRFKKSNGVFIFAAVAVFIIGALIFLVAMTFLLMNIHKMPAQSGAVDGLQVMLSYLIDVLIVTCVGYYMITECRKIR